MSDIQVLLTRGALVWRSGMAVDADGSPRAYHPDGAPGLDHIGNAHKDPRDLSSPWCGVVLDARGEPVVQGPGDPAPGFYVSPTSLYDARYSRTDPRRYVDSEAVCYVTATRDMISRGARMGDAAFVCYGGASAAAVVADFGPHPGEGSIALCRALGIPADPRHGGVTAPAVSFAVFPGSGRGNPWPYDFASRGAALFEGWGGSAALAAALA